jgi:hypothetical protein
MVLRNNIHNRKSRSRVLVHLGALLISANRFDSPTDCNDETLLNDGPMSPAVVFALAARPSHSLRMCGESEDVRLGGPAVVELELRSVLANNASFYPQILAKSPFFLSQRPNKRRGAEDAEVRRVYRSYKSSAHLCAPALKFANWQSNRQQFSAIWNNPLEMSRWAKGRRAESDGSKWRFLPLAKQYAMP